MKSSVYIESSVISYLAARPSRDIVSVGRQAITDEWWTNRRVNYDLFISPLVIEEISGGDTKAAQQRLTIIDGIPSLSITPEAELVATSLLASKALPKNSARDALHIAIAATQGIDYLLTWNFKHINNATTRVIIMNSVIGSGYLCPILCSPEELEEDNENE